MLKSEDISIPPGIRETTSEDGAVLLDIEQGVCFSMNSLGLRIWNMLKQYYSIDQIADSLEREFQVSRVELVSDIREFVEKLEAKRLIRHKDWTAPDRGWLAKLLA